MVEAWIRAGSAELQESVQAAAPSKTESTADAVVEVLSALGVQVTDEDGGFVGADTLTENLRAALAQQEESGGEKQDKEELLSLTREKLDELAASMELDSSKCKTKGEVADLILAAKSGSTS